MSGRMSCGCGFWYGMSVASATVSGRGLFKVLISRNWVMVDGCLAYPNGGIGDRVPNTFHLLLPSFKAYSQISTFRFDSAALIVFGWKRVGYVARSTPSRTAILTPMLLEALKNSRWSLRAFQAPHILASLPLNPHA
jgi:hypothetical protein